ncbi:MAG: cell division protein FtsL [Pseudomonadota bacterium]
MTSLYRFMTVGLVLVTLALAANLYRTTYKTRIIEHDLKASERKMRELERDVATLKAERAYLARPERISEAARALGMQPLRGDQVSHLPRPKKQSSDRAVSREQALRTDRVVPAR